MWRSKRILPRGQVASNSSRDDKNIEMNKQGAFVFGDRKVIVVDFFSK